MNRGSTKIDEILDHAVDIESTDERRKYLDNTCGTDAELRRQVEELIAHHFAAGAFLEQPALQALVDLAPSNNGQRQAGQIESSPQNVGGRMLGDFRIVREIGHGGMGIVYEAEQESLKRRVALKVLPFAAVLDPRQLKRFKNEAMAAAQLHHQNIVPVYQVGCERAVHFFAMPYIEGQNVAELIQQLRRLSGADQAEAPPPDVKSSQLANDLASGRFAPPEKTKLASRAKSSNGVNAAKDSNPQQQVAETEGRSAGLPKSQSASRNPQAEIEGSAIDTRPLAMLSTEHSTRTPDYFRTVAGLGIQAAMALDFAHEQGIVHRDVKPSNLMLDEQGKLWVTDFGLAQNEANANLTMTGDIVGTLRYMSPEQALGKRGVVDQRSDIYSLGATLYELLTLTPVFSGSDRRELFQQIADKEPRPPHALNNAVPRDLETIVLKALAKDMADRYTTAAELADDLRRFLTGEPIRARRISAVAHFDRFCRRNPVVTALTGTMASLLLVGFVVASIAASQFQDLAEQRKQAETNAEEARDEAERQRDEADQQRDAAKYELYVASIRLAHQQWPEGHVGSVLKLLDRQVPIPGEPDLRGWEWYYLKSLCSSDVATLRGQSAAVLSVAWAPDGARLASASDDGTIKVWDTLTYEELTSFRGHEDAVNSVAWSPDGRRLASASSDHTVRIWNAVTYQPTLIIPAGSGIMQQVAWSPDGMRLATAADDGTVNIWNAKAGNEILALKGHVDKAWSVAWSPDGKRLASGGGYVLGDIRIWDTTSGKQLHEILDPAAQRGGHRVYSITWSPDGKHLVTTNRHEYKIWETRNWKQIHGLSYPDDGAKSTGWEPNGKRLATGGEDGIVNLWDATTWQKVRTIRGHTGPVRSVAWRSDGRRLASASIDGTIKFWDPDRQQGAIKLAGRGRVSFSPDSRLLATRPSPMDVAAGDRAITIFDTTTRKQISAIPIEDLKPSWVNSIAWSPDGQHLAAAFSSGLRDAVAASSKGAVKAWEVATGKELFSLTAHTGGAFSVAWNVDGSMIASGGKGANAVEVWDLTNRKKVVTLSTQKTTVGHVAKPRHDLINHRQNDGSLAWSPDGRRLATNSSDPVIKIWDVLNWREILQLAPGGSSVTWSPDGNRLAAAGTSGRLMVWDTATGRRLLELHGPTRIRSIIWSPDGRRLVSGTQHSMTIWNADTGDQLLKLKKKDGVADVQNLAWSPDGRIVSYAEFGGSHSVTLFDATEAMRATHTLKNQKTNR